MRSFASIEGGRISNETGGRALPFISIIIPAHNEEEFLPRTLEALRQEDGPEKEVIVVANGCTDRSVEVAEGRCDQLIELPKRGLGPARNTGARQARGNLLLFLDADTVLQSGALKVIAREFARTHAMGTLKGIPDSRKAAYRLLYFAKNVLHKTHAHHGSSGVILCWKDDFHAVGGFNNELYLRENSDLMKKLRPFGQYKYIAGAAAVTSMRRYEQAGLGQMFWLWLTVWYLSNFSDLRNQTYEGMSEGMPHWAKVNQWVLRKLAKRREALRARNAPMAY